MAGAGRKLAGGVAAELIADSVVRARRYETEDDQTGMVERGPWPVQLHDGGDGQRRDARPAPANRAGQSREVQAHAFPAGREVDLAANAVDPLPPPEGVGVQAPRDTKAGDQPVGLARLLVARPGGLVGPVLGSASQPAK
jgi:hypothetical protein